MTKTTLKKIGHIDVSRDGTVCIETTYEWEGGLEPAEYTMLQPDDVDLLLENLYHAKITPPLRWRITKKGSPK